MLCPLDHVDWEALLVEKVEHSVKIWNYQAARSSWSQCCYGIQDAEEYRGDQHQYIDQLFGYPYFAVVVHDVPEAVIDKDRSASLLAKLIDADTLLILTAVDKVCINYNTPNELTIDNLTVNKALEYINEGHFAKGSMLPKIEACIDFVKDNSNKKAIIGSLEKAQEAIKGESGTIITK